MTGCRTSGIAALALMAAASAAQAQSLLAVPDGAKLTLWDTSTDPAFARFADVKRGTPGGCYVVNGAKITPDSDATACLGHLRMEGDLVTGGADPYDIIGVVRALDVPLSDYSQGFVITGVRGVDYCGERENCDDIYVLGVRGDAALTRLAQAVRSGNEVRVQGPGVWHLESIDIVIERISPAK